MLASAMYREPLRLVIKEAHDGFVQFVESQFAGGLQDSSAVNHECCGIACDISVETRDLTIVGQQGICHGHLCQAFSLCSRVFVRKAENYETLLFMFLIQVVEFWHFRQAVSAPGRPNINQYNLALVIGETLIISIEITGLKGRRRNIVSSFVPHPNPEQNRTADKKCWKRERDYCEKQT